MANHLFTSAWLLILACLVFSASVAPAATFYVSPTGNDANPGTEAKPFATPGRALHAVRELRLPETDAGPVTVYFRGGTYELVEPLRFAPEDTGTGGSPVTYASYPGERAVWSGGRRIPGPWRPVPGKPYWETTVPPNGGKRWVFNSLFVNGESRLRARCPNWGEKVFRAEGRAPGEDERQAFVYFPGDINPAWTDLTDIDLVLLCSWTPTIHRIREVVPSRRVVRFHSTHGRSVDFWEKNFRYYVANVFEALDAPGEWYLNRRTGTLYYYPLPGEDMAKAEVIAPVLTTRIIHFDGDVAKGRFVAHLRFCDLDIRHVDGDLSRYDGMYRQGHMFLGAAIYAEGLRSSVFSNCEIAQIGEYAIELGAGCRDNRIERCHIWDLGAGAMQIGLTDLAALLSARVRPMPGDIVLEAEAATVRLPMAVQHDPKASGGAYVVLPDGQAGGQTAFSVSLPKPGPYRLFAQVLAPSGNADSFVVRVNDGPELTYDTGVGSSWFLSQVVARELEGKTLTAELRAGDNTITFA
ncbi:MAG: hypothetical protein FJ272_09515, partial [Planctomycetes bacterium]|nr:hypothetical protein [Planctomycetota bacterium]